MLKNWLAGWMAGGCCRVPNRPCRHHTFAFNLLVIINFPKDITHYVMFKTMSVPGLILKEFYDIYRIILQSLHTAYFQCYPLFKDHLFCEIIFHGRRGGLWRQVPQKNRDRPTCQIRLTPIFLS